MQKAAADLSITKAGLKRDDIRYLFAGDLLGQLIATSFGTVDLEIPLFGLYGACSTMGEAMSLGNNDGKCRLCGSCAIHGVQPFCHRRKTVPFSSCLREPAPYVFYLDGDWVRGSRHWERGAAGDWQILTAFTAGKAIDIEARDSMNMGAAMAPGGISYNRTESGGSWNG